MTVKELIKELEKIDEDAKIYYEYDGMDCEVDRCDKENIKDKECAYLK